MKKGQQNKRIYFALALYNYECHFRQKNSCEQNSCSLHKFFKTRALNPPTY